MMVGASSLIGRWFIVGDDDGRGGVRVWVVDEG
jgi:hypothetical protein